MARSAANGRRVKSAVHMHSPFWQVQLFGQILVPDNGHVFVPPHLRVLHVVQETSAAT